MKRVIGLILALLLLIGGIGTLLYPRIQQELYEREAQRVIAAFNARLDVHRAESADGSLDWLYELIRAYNEELYQTGQVHLADPFSLEQIGFSLRQFGFDEEMIGFIEIPRINSELPIYLGASDANLARGAAHLTHTSLPIGGSNTNAVIAAHSGWTRARFFSAITELRHGDDIFIHNFRETLHYQVVETLVIMPNDIEQIVIQPERDLVTLLTCYQRVRGVWQRRYLVFAERVEE